MQEKKEDLRAIQKEIAVVEAEMQDLITEVEQLKDDIDRIIAYINNLKKIIK